MQHWLDLAKRSQIVDLAQEWFPGMPHWPTHPPFAMAMTKEHGDYVLPGGVSAAAELIALGTHVGTHIDGLGHFSCGGKFYQGREMKDIGIDTVKPIFRRGVLVDCAARGPLAEDRGITLADLQASLRTDVQPGDVVLVRTGWGALWNDQRRFVNEQRQPGITLEAAQWLSSQGVFAVGADNVAVERIPSPRMEVHVHLLVESGIHLLECMNLEALAQQQKQEFLFVAAPLKLRGATGSPLRPFAIFEE